MKTSHKTLALLAIPGLFNPLYAQDAEEPTSESPTVEVEGVAPEAQAAPVIATEERVEQALEVKKELEAVDQKPESVMENDAAGKVDSEPEAPVAPTAPDTPAVTEPTTPVVPAPPTPPLDEPSEKMKQVQEELESVQQKPESVMENDAAGNVDTEEPEPMVKPPLEPSPTTVEIERDAAPMPVQPAASPKPPVEEKMTEVETPAPVVPEAEPNMAPAAPTPRVTKQEAPAKAVPASQAAPETTAVPERPRPAAKQTAETKAVLKDNEEPNRNRAAERQAAAKIEDDDDAKKLIYGILGGAAAGVVTSKIIGSSKREQEDLRRERELANAPRLAPEQVGRTARDREQSVTYIVQQLENGAPAAEAPPAFRQRPVRYQDQVAVERVPQYYGENRRVVRYANRSEVPPILIANGALDRVSVAPLREATYVEPSPTNRTGDNQASEMPSTYYGRDAYVVSYPVDKAAALSQDAILFQQGSTNFADAYSYDLVIDMAEAMNHPALVSNLFVVEGHASAEGDFLKNQDLSQRRAERIVREMVRYGVNPERLIPVGYGETEAAYPADSPERLRSTDRRVMIFKLDANQNR